MTTSEDMNRARARVICLTDGETPAVEALRTRLLDDRYAATFQSIQNDIAAATNEADALLIDARDPGMFSYAAKQAKRWSETGDSDRPVAILVDPLEEETSLKAFLPHAELVFAPRGASAAGAARVRELLRLRNMAEETAARLHSFASAGVVELPSPSFSEKTVNALAVGAPSRHFLAAEKALAAKGFTFVAALTSATAFDYLEHGPFDVVIAFADTDPEEIAAIAAAMRRNARLHNTPVIAAVDPKSTSAEDLFSRGVSEIVAPARLPHVLAERVDAYARTHRLSDALRGFLSAPPPAEVREASGLFTSRFFGRHFPTVAERAEANGRPLSVACFRLLEHAEIAAAHGPAAAERVVRQTADLMRLLIRVEDTAVRLAEDTILIVFPSTLREDADVAARRIAGVVGHSRFIARDDDGGVAMHVRHGVVEHVPGAAAEETLAQALAAMARRLM
ncbi:MAG: diguanylate cyclase [Pseudomonadota bacterium]